MDKYKDDEKAFVFLDPPYFDSFNSDYIGFTEKDNNKSKIKFDNTYMYIDILEFFKNAKCKVMMVINKYAITEYLYKDFIKGEYDKLYQITKKQTKHIILTNY